MTVGNCDLGWDFGWDGYYNCTYHAIFKKEDEGGYISVTMRNNDEGRGCFEIILDIRCGNSNIMTTIINMKNTELSWDSQGQLFGMIVKPIEEYIRKFKPYELFKIVRGPKEIQPEIIQAIMPYFFSGGVRI